MKNSNILHNQIWGWGTHTKVGIAEGFLLLYILVNFTMKTPYVWQGVVITISQQIRDVKIATNLCYMCQDTNNGNKHSTSKRKKNFPCRRMLQKKDTLT